LSKALKCAVLTSGARNSREDFSQRVLEQVLSSGARPRRSTSRCNSVISIVVSPFVRPLRTARLNASA